MVFNYVSASMWSRNRAWMFYFVMNSPRRNGRRVDVGVNIFSSPIPAHTHTHPFRSYISVLDLTNLCTFYEETRGYSQRSFLVRWILESNTKNQNVFYGTDVRKKLLLCIGIRVIFSVLWSQNIHWRSISRF